MIQASSGASNRVNNLQKGKTNTLSGIVIPYYYAIKKGFKLNESKNSIPHEIDIKFNGKLRDYQIIPYNDTLNTLKTEGGCLLSQRTGSGKTVCSIHLISELKVKTLIVVNKEFLLNQWIERIKQYTNLTEIGKIQGDKVNIEPPIVIGMLQSMALKNYPYQIFEQFDFVIFDEVHNLAGDIFSNVLFYIGKKRYILGLSATPERLDGMEKYIFMAFKQDFGL